MPGAPALNRTESFQYPAAHLGHLNPAQAEALEAFRKLCLEGGYYKPAGTDGPYASHDDETLLRYLRARRFVPSEAYKQFSTTEEWRKENNIVELYETIDIHEYEQCRKLYPQWMGVTDRRSIPLYLFEVAHLNSKSLASYEKETAKTTVSHKVPTKMLRLFALYESLTRFVMPLCSTLQRPHFETPISQSNNIVDISKVGLKQFWNLKSHMQDASQLATAHYPETLDRIFIIGAPSWFSTVWGWINKWFDPITVSKIFILPQAEVYSTLSKYIDPGNIPKKYGGKLDFEFGMMPILAPEIQDSLIWENPEKQDGRNIWPIGPIKWEESADGTVKAVAVGTENGVRRNRVICRLKTDISIKAMHGSLVTGNTPIPDDELALTTVGTATHPDITNVDLYEGADPSQHTPASSVTPKSNESQDLPIRSGTSETKFTAQSKTHAAGQLADGTPDAAVVKDGDGEKSVAMEPTTVGQAPKEVPIPQPEEPKPGYVKQAKVAVESAVGSAVEAVEKVVGSEKVAEKTEVPKEKSEEEKQLDGKLQEQGPIVEGFLREKYSSTT